jgi:copper(I)-binding protein
VTVTDARVRLLGGGEGELVMSVRNGGSAPEHLYLVSTPDAASTSFDGPNGVDSILSPAGVLLEPGGTVSLGGHGAARVLLYGLHGTDSEHDVPFILIFANVGLVHLQALPPAR